MYPVNGQEDKKYNSKTVIVRGSKTWIRIHEHDFISIGTKKERSIIICSTCGLVYCEKCGKLRMIHNKNYMQNNRYS